MEPGFFKGQSDNLPKVDTLMVAAFFRNNPDFISAEMKGVKVVRSSRENYGDAAVGYVQVKREGKICSVKGNITPEHKVKKKPYTVHFKCNEEDGVVLSIMCEDCAASLGGCKHAVAFLTWLHRRSEEPSTTSVKCYWKKSKLSSVETSQKCIKVASMGKVNVPENDRTEGAFLHKVMEHSEKIGRTDTVLTKYFKQFSATQKLSLHYLLQDYLSLGGELDADDFRDFCSNSMCEETCIQASDETDKQADSPLWHELRYARITASKVYAAMHCKTQGTLLDTILGATKLKCTGPMKRGQLLEQKVFTTVQNSVRRVRIRNQVSCDSRQF